MEKIINLLLICVLFLGTSCLKETGNTNYVNPFIGTGGHGHTFPGATTPFGMVQLSPDTRTTGWDACGGYHYTDSTIIGFSHTHISGTGIGDYGDILFMPFTGEAKINAGTPETPGVGYRSRFGHKQETAVPGYYAVNLKDYGIMAELTATARAGFHRYTFPKSRQSGIIIDLSHDIYNQEDLVDEIRVISNTEIEGSKKTRGWAENHHVYFYAKFNKPFKYKLYGQGGTASAISEFNSRHSKAVLLFDTEQDERVLAKVGISAVDCAGAKNNLDEEIPGWGFEKVKQAARDQWDEQLGKIEVEGGTKDQKTIFYTSLYHVSISPNIFNDVDGRYRGMDRKIHNAGENNMYTLFPLWDTFRALHPLQTIIDPKRDNDFIRSLLCKYDEGGILPKWELAGNYTGTMIGYHSVPVIVDAYMKGMRDFDVAKAYRAMVASAVYDTTGILAPSPHIKEMLMPKGRYYNDQLGYIPANFENESVSKALEYAYDDWCIAQMAKELGKENDYRFFMERSKRYQKYFDIKTGFMRGRNADGSWKEPFDPRFSRHGGGDYTEGNAFQWTWFVPHDVVGLMGLMGGRQQFIERLDTLFSTTSEIEGEQASVDISGMIGQYAHGNEPSHHITHLYNFAGQSWKTQELADSIMSSLYLNNPDGLSGNEDCGQMSAWYIFNAMGLYSFCPGIPEYSIGRPIFNQVKINLSNGNSFFIKTNNNSKKNRYIQSIILNQEKLNTHFIKHKDIINGGELVFEMGSVPDKE